MPDHQHMQDTVERYIAAFNDGDADAAIGLYATDATLEDPVGSEAKRGIDAIGEFYRGAMSAGVQLRLDGPVRTAGDIAAFAFSMAMGGEPPQRLHVIDTFRFDEDGKVVEMRAVWGPANIIADD